jgi:hypothetical protein
VVEARFLLLTNYEGWPAAVRPKGLVSLSGDDASAAASLPLLYTSTLIGPSLRTKAALNATTFGKQFAFDVMYIVISVVKNFRSCLG